MFGFGTYLKKVSPIRKVDLIKRYKAITCNGDVRAYHSIDCQVYEMNYFFNVVPERKLIYIEISKAGSSTIKTILANVCYGRTFDENPALCHNRSYSGLKSPKMVGEQEFVRLIDDPETLIFTVVRNPFLRLQSCYSDKFTGAPITDGGNPYLKQFFETVGHRSSYLSDGELTFEEFVRFACSTASKRLNGHWSLMSDNIPVGLDTIRVMKLENLQNDIGPVADRLGVDADLFGAARTAKNTTESCRFDTMWTDKLVARVRRAYRKDFKRFDYSLAFPPRPFS